MVGREVRNFRARYVFPVVGPPIPDGVVSVAGGRIVAVGRKPLDGPVEELGSVALVPGLINAHTHLEFSLLDQPIGRPGMRFSEWVRELVRQFRPVGVSREAAAEWTDRPAALQEKPSSEEVLRAGWAELLRSGTTAVADIAQSGFPDRLWSRSGMQAAVFLELRAPTRKRVSQAVEDARHHIEAWQALAIAQVHDSAGAQAGVLEAELPIGTAALPLNVGWAPGEESDLWTPWQLGLSPHAPYTVRLELLEAAVALARTHHLPLAMHLAESEEEIELLRTGQGPLRVLLEELGQWEPDLIRPGSRPLDYLRRLAQADRALVIHGTYLGPEDYAFLAEQRDRVCVVFCPRSHGYFAHREYPLAQMVAQGVRVVLGTDSRASAPEMNLWEELRYVVRRFPDVAPERILRLGTLDSAAALGWAEDVGSLQPGRRADMTAVALPEQADSQDPYELLWDRSLSVVATWLAGRKVFSAPAEAPTG